MVESLLAVFLVLVTGAALRSTGIVAPGQWLGLERVTYQVLFPAVIVHTLMLARLGSLPLAAMGSALVLAILAVALLLLALRPALARAGLSGPGFTSVFQGSIRWNTFVGLAVAAGLHGREGSALMAIAVASMIPLLNLLCVLVLARLGSGGQVSLAATARSLALNPFIWSSALGLALNPLQGAIPGFVIGYVDVMGRAALGVGLLVVGAGIDPGRMALPRLPHLLAIGLKLLVLPLIAWGLARSFGLSGTALACTVIAASVPTASSAYFLARDMGGDAELMAEITALQTLLAIVTLPIAVLYLT